MDYRYNHTKNHTDFARTNRKKQTDAEKLLWSKLRNKKLGYKFRRQYPIAGYILDFYCVEEKIAIELDGSQHRDNKEYDDERTNILQGYGVTVLRFWDNDLLRNTDTVLERILEYLT